MDTRQSNPTNSLCRAPPSGMWQSVRAGVRQAYYYKEEGEKTGEWNGLIIKPPKQCLTEKQRESQSTSLDEFEYLGQAVGPSLQKSVPLWVILSSWACFLFCKVGLPAVPTSSFSHCKSEAPKKQSETREQLSEISKGLTYAELLIHVDYCNWQ